MKLTTIILAAGEGTRMKSHTPKVMHNIAGRPMLAHLLHTVSQLKTEDIRIVASRDLMNYAPVQTLKEICDFKYFEQIERLGTAHALNCGLSEKLKSPALVLSGDAPLVTLETIKNMQKVFTSEKAAIVCLAFKTKAPYGYGRLITFDQDMLDIIEEKDANAVQKKIRLCNSGIYIIDHTLIKELLAEIKNENKAKEYYLTDIVRIANKRGLKCCYTEATKEEVHGINTRAQLAEAEAIVQKRLRTLALENGVSMTDPKTVYFSMDTKFGQDVIIHPHVFFGEGVSIGDGTEILPFTHIEGTKIGDLCRIGPYSRIRAHSYIGNNSRIGNFVEVKATTIQPNVRASHLSYLGDGEIGENSNIGAGTIFCNYDGYAKHRTQIGKDVFIGSNVALVAPIAVGNGAIIGAGSVITEDIEDDALSIGRARQINFKQKADLIRKKKAEDKS